MAVWDHKMPLLIWKLSACVFALLSDTSSFTLNVGVSRSEVTKICGNGLGLSRTVSSVSSSKWGTQSLSKTSSRLEMALTPVGPFCPFRSKATVEMEPRMEGLQASNVGEFGTEMQRIQLDMQMGQIPDPERLNKVADGIEKVSKEQGVAICSANQTYWSLVSARILSLFLCTDRINVLNLFSMLFFFFVCFSQSKNGKD